MNINRFLNSILKEYRVNSEWAKKHPNIGIAFHLAQGFEPHASLSPAILRYEPLISPGNPW